MYTISKQFHFSASHQLVGLPAEHPCARLHGHNYVYEVVLCSETVNADAMVFDYGLLKPLDDAVQEWFDHRDLNERLTALYIHYGVPADRIESVKTTAENIARAIHWLATLRLSLPPAVSIVAVRVSETPRTWAEYRS